MLRDLSNGPASGVCPKVKSAPVTTAVGFMIIMPFDQFWTWVENAEQLVRRFNEL